MKRMRDLLAVLANRHRGRIRGFAAALAALAMLAGMAGAGSIAFADEATAENGGTAVESMDDRKRTARPDGADATEDDAVEDVASEDGGPERATSDGSPQGRLDGRQSQQTEDQPGTKDQFGTGDQLGGGQPSAGSDGLSEDGDAPVQSDDCKDDAGQSGADDMAGGVADTEAGGEGSEAGNDDADGADGKADAGTAGKIGDDADDADGDGDDTDGDDAAGNDADDDDEDDDDEDGNSDLAAEFTFTDGSTASLVWFYADGGLVYNEEFSRLPGDAIAAGTN